MASTSKTQTEWDQMRRRFSGDEVLRILATMTYTSPTCPGPWDLPEARCCPTLIGKAGHAKSYIVKQYADMQSFGFKVAHGGTDADEDWTGLPAAEYTNGVMSGVQFLPPPNIPTSEPMLLDIYGNPITDDEGVAKLASLGLWFIDEIMTGSIVRQNQVRQAISDRRVANLSIPRRWWIIGATNPDTRDYLTVKSMDEAVLDRILYIPVEHKKEHIQSFWASHRTRFNDKGERVIARKPYFIFDLSGENADKTWEPLPPLLYKFLHYQPLFIDAVSPRRWVVVGDAWRRYEATLAKGYEWALPHDIMLSLVGIWTQNEIASSLQAFIKLGEDPKNYMITFNELVNADDKKYKEHMDTVRSWERGSPTHAQALIASTGFDIAKNLSTAAEGDKITKPKLRRVADFLAQAGQADLAVRIVREAGQTKAAEELVTICGQNPQFKKKLANLSELQQALVLKGAKIEKDNDTTTSKE